MAAKVDQVVWLSVDTEGMADMVVMAAMAAWAARRPSRILVNVLPLGLFAHGFHGR